MCRLGHLEHWCGDEGHHAGAYAAEGTRHPHVVLKLSEEQRYEENDEKRRRNTSQRGEQCSRHAPDFVAYEYGYINGEDARTRLRHGHKVEQVFARNPLPLINHLGFDERYHGIASTYCEETYVEECGKKVDT